MADSKETALTRVGLFGELNKRQMKKLVSIADVASAPEGKALVTEGARGRELLVLLEGAAEVRRGGQTIAELGPGDAIGEMALLDHQPATATVVATEPCELVVIEGRQFASLIDDLPGLAQSLLATLTARLREADKAYDHV